MIFDQQSSIRDKARDHKEVNQRVALFIGFLLVGNLAAAPAAHGDSGSPPQSSGPVKQIAAAIPVPPQARTAVAPASVSGINDGTSGGGASTSAAERTADKVLKGTVMQDGKRSPLLFGSVQSIPKGTAIDITFCGNVNSEVSQKGDEVFVKVSKDVAGGDGVGVPGGWYMHGLVTDSSGQRRLGRDGFVEIEFDKLVSPDGEYELPFHAAVSTKDGLLKSIAKVAAIDTGFVAEGAFGGALASVQMTGLPVAIASHGYSVAIGAGVGATLGTIGALKRKGKIASLYPGDPMRLVTADSISLPGFDKSMLPSGKVHDLLKNMEITINKTSFSKDPMGDRRASLLTVDLTMANKTAKEYTFMDLAVVSDLNERFFPSLFGGLQQLEKAVKPQSEQNGVVTFEVESKKRKYWLVLLDRAKQNELSRVPLN